MARSFDAANDSLQSAAVLSTLSGKSRIAVSFWVSTDFAADDDILLELSADSNTNAGSFCFIASDSVATTSIQIVVNGNVGKNNLFIPSVNPGNWHHFLLNLDFSQALGEVGAFRDGIEEGGTKTLVDNNTGTFGSYVLNVMSRNNASLWADGEMSDLCIWTPSSVLTLAEAQLLASGVRADQVRNSDIAYYWPLAGTTSPEPASIGSTALTVNGAIQFADPERFEDTSATLAGPDVIKTGWATNGWGQSGGVLTSPPINCLDGDMLIFTVMAEAGNVGYEISGGTGFDWHYTEQEGGSSNCTVGTGIARVVGNQFVTITATPDAGARGGLGWIQLRGTSVINQVHIIGYEDSQVPQVTLTTYDDNSVIVFAVANWDAVSTASTSYYTASAGSCTEVVKQQNGIIDGAGTPSSYATWFGYYPSPGTKGSKTVGLITPSTQHNVVMAVEVRPATGALKYIFNTFYEDRNGSPTRAVKGLAFTVDETVEVLAFRYCNDYARWFNNNYARQYGLWNEAGTLIASETATVKDEAYGTWGELPLDTPVSISPGQTYTVGYLDEMGDEANYYFVNATNVLTNATDNPPFHTPAGAGRTSNSGTLIRPTGTDNTLYGVDVLAQIPVSAEYFVYARPDADTDITGWTDQAGGSSNLYAVLDETVASDTDYIKATS